MTYRWGRVSWVDKYHSESIWLQTTSNEKKFKLVALKLRRYASPWWTNVCARREREDKEKIHEWDKMKKKLKAKFLLFYYMQDNYRKLHHFEQERGRLCKGIWISRHEMQYKGKWWLNNGEVPRGKTREILLSFNLTLPWRTLLFLQIRLRGNKNPREKKF